MKKPINWKKIIRRTCWVLSGIGLIVLTGAAMQHKKNKVCREVRIEISGAEKHLFIDEKDVMDLLNTNGPVTGIPIQSLKLRQMEQMVEQNKWVKNAEMFFDNNQVLQIQIQERQPVARVFQTDGTTFYLDSSAVLLPLSNKLTVRVPVFTGFPVTSGMDSVLVQQVIDLAKHIAADSFFSAQITQIDITTDRKFELTPLIGDHIVRFGEATDIDNKFSRLNAFYRSAWLQHGINTYETIDVQYKNQVVGIKQGTAKAYSDSAAALSLIKNTAMFPPATDTASVKPVSPVLKPARPVLKRKDPVVVKPLAVKTATAKTVTAKPAAVKPAKTAKTLMPKNNKKIQKPLRT